MQPGQQVGIEHPAGLDHADLPYQVKFIAARFDEGLAMAKLGTSQRVLLRSTGAPVLTGLVRIFLIWIGVANVELTTLPRLPPGPETGGP